MSALNVTSTQLGAFGIDDSCYTGTNGNYSTTGACKISYATPDATFGFPIATSVDTFEVVRILYNSFS